MKKQLFEWDEAKSERNRVERGFGISACAATNSVGENVRRFIDWAKAYSSVLKSVCDPSELDRVLEDEELFRPPTVVTDKWFEIVSSD